MDYSDEYDQDVEDPTQETLWETPQPVSPDQIVPPDKQQELIFWRDVFRKGMFRIGEIALECVDEAMRQGLPVTQSQIYHAVGRFCGKSGRTVRGYAEVTAFFPEAIRQEYEVLPFQHFVFAKSMGERWKEVLDYAAQNPSYSLEALTYQFLYGIDPEKNVQDTTFVEGEFKEVSTDEEYEEPEMPTRRYTFLKWVSRFCGLMDNFNNLFRENKDLLSDPRIPPKVRRDILETSKSVEEDLARIQKVIAKLTDLDNPPAR